MTDQTDMTSPRPLAELRSDLASVVTALWFDIDHHNGISAASFFTPDAELTFSRATFHGTAAIERVYRYRADRGPRVSRHLMSNLHITRHESRLAETVSVLILYAQDGTPPLPSSAPLLIADVLDRFVPVTDASGGLHQWLIASRRIENRFMTPGQTLAVPTE